MTVHHEIIQSQGFYPITQFYLSAVIVLVLTVQGLFSLGLGIVCLAVCAVWAVLVAAWRDLKTVHLLVNGQRHELLTEIADLKQLLRKADIQVPAGPAEKRQQTKETTKEIGQ